MGDELIEVTISILRKDSANLLPEQRLDTADHAPERVDQRLKFRAVRVRLVSNLMDDRAKHLARNFLGHFIGRQGTELIHDALDMGVGVDDDSLRVHRHEPEWIGGRSEAVEHDIAVTGVPLRKGAPEPCDGALEGLGEASEIRSLRDPVNQRIGNGGLQSEERDARARDRDRIGAGSGVTLLKIRLPAPGVALEGEGRGGY